MTDEMRTIAVTVNGRRHEQAVGATDTYDGRSVALADLWNRGVLDVIVTNQRGPLLIYKNTVAPENTWIDFELEGTASNRSAMGAQVRVSWNGRQQVQTTPRQPSVRLGWRGRFASLTAVRR